MLSGLPHDARKVKARGCQVQCLGSSPPALATSARHPSACAAWLSAFRILGVHGQRPLKPATRALKVVPLLTCRNPEPEAGPVLAVGIVLRLAEPQQLAQGGICLREPPQQAGEHAGPDQGLGDIWTGRSPRWGKVRSIHDRPSVIPSVQALPPIAWVGHQVRHSAPA